MSGACMVFWYPDGIRTQCGKPAEMVRAGCVHEHVTDRPRCRDCIATELICTLCLEGPRPHECPVVIVPLAQVSP